jgi:hypothetical protein
VRFGYNRLPVPGPPCTTMVSQSGARIRSSCSGWMVATMSRIGPMRGRSISAASNRPAVPSSSPSHSGSSWNEVSAPRW